MEVTKKAGSHGDFRLLACVLCVIEKLYLHIQKHQYFFEVTIFIK